MFKINIRRIVINTLFINLIIFLDVIGNTTFSIAPDPYGANVNAWAEFGTGLAEGLNNGLNGILERQNEEMAYQRDLRRQEAEYQKQIEILGPILENQGQPVELAEILVRNPEVGIHLLNNAQSNKKDNNV